MDKQRFLKILTFYDKVLIAVIMMIVVVSYVIIFANMRKPTDAIAVIQQNNEVILQLTQVEMEQDGILDFEFDGGSGQIGVKDKKIRMLPMNKNICPEAVCSETGWIENSPQIIVCLPNRLIVSFISDESNEIDAVVY